MAKIDIIAVSHEDGVVSIRTDMGADAARRLAEFELNSELHISIVVEAVKTRLDALRERAAVMKRKKKEGMVEPTASAPPVYDYVFTKQCGRTPSLPDVDHSVNLRALAAARVVTGEAAQSSGVDPTVSTRRRLKSLREHLLEKIRAEIAEEAALEALTAADGEAELSEAEKHGDVRFIEPDMIAVG